MGWVHSGYKGLKLQSLHRVQSSPKSEELCDLKDRAMKGRLGIDVAPFRTGSTLVVTLISDPEFGCTLLLGQLGQEEGCTRVHK